VLASEQLSGHGGSAARVREMLKSIGDGSERVRRTRDRARPTGTEQVPKVLANVTFPSSWSLLRMMLVRGA